VVEYCYAVKSLCRVFAQIVTIFLLMLDSNALIVFSSDLLWWFHPVVIAHNNKWRWAGPIKYTACALSHGCFTLPLMLIHGRGVPTIFFASNYCNGSTFHRQSQCDVKNSFFFAIGATVRTLINDVRNISALIRMAPNCLAFGSFPRPSNDEK